MALKSSMLFCCRFASAGPAENPRSDDRSPGTSAVGTGSPSAAARFLLAAASFAGGSTIGHTKPVRGVYVGLWERRVSRDFWSECSEVS